MSATQTNCPACGARVEFKIGSSMVVVCAYCRSLVARGDRNVEDLGKVAALVDTGSPLEVGLEGKYEGQRFRLVGRAQLKHPMGGIWDEWYAAFPNDRWGWLAEAQGRFYLTFRQPPVRNLPTFSDVMIGARLPVGNGMKAVEKAKAEAASAEGEIPYRLMPGQEFYFVDLSGPQSTFGTIDYGDDPPAVYVGSEVTLDQLGIPKTARRREGRQVAGVKLSCPQCGAALALRAPDRTETVVCPSCGSMLDVNQGELKFLKALEKGKVEPVLPIGSVGKLPEGDLTVIGMIQRFVTFDGIKYFWQEYLLYEPRLGFRWMVSSDQHWNYVQNVAPGHIGGNVLSPEYEGKSFKIFQKAQATVSYVVGECYWKVRIGDQAATADYIAPPLMLSNEKSIGKDVEEIVWSLCTYMPVADVEKAFSVTNLPAPEGVAPNQLFPYWPIYRYWGYFVLAALLLSIVIFLLSPRRLVTEQNYMLEPFENEDKAQVFFVEGLELKSRQNIRVTGRANVSNSWVFVAGDLINEETNETQPFSFPIEEYAGVEDGESWSEGSDVDWVNLSALPAGKYTLRIEVTGQPQSSTTPGMVSSRATRLHLTVEQGVPRWGHLFLVLFLLSLIPGYVVVRHVIFEASRWSNSDTGEEKSSGSDDSGGFDD